MKSQYPLPVPSAPQKEWEDRNIAMEALGFRLQESLEGPDYAVWPVSARIFTHAAFDAFCEVTLLPTEIFLVQFVSLFPESSVRTVASEKLWTFSASNLDDRTAWVGGSLASVWEEHVKRAAGLQAEDQTHPLGVELEIYHDFLRTLQNGLMKDVRQGRIVPQTLHDFVLLGYGYLQLGQPRKSVEMFRRAAESNPANAQIHWLAGRAALHANDYKTAAESLGQFLLLNPRDHESYLLRVLALERLNQKREIYDTLKKAKGFFPEDSGIVMKLGETALEIGDLRAAAANLEELNNPKGASEELFNALGRLYAKLKDRKKSEEYFRLARVFKRQRKGDRLPWG